MPCSKVRSIEFEPPSHGIFCLISKNITNMHVNTFLMHFLKFCLYPSSTEKIPPPKKTLDTHLVMGIYMLYLFIKAYV